MRHREEAGFVARVVQMIAAGAEVGNGRISRMIEENLPNVRLVILKRRPLGFLTAYIG